MHHTHLIGTRNSGSCQVVPINRISPSLFHVKCSSEFQFPPQMKYDGILKYYRWYARHCGSDFLADSSYWVACQHQLHHSNRRFAGWVPVRRDSRYETMWKNRLFSDVTIDTVCIDELVHLGHLRSMRTVPTVTSVASVIPARWSLALPCTTSIKLLVEAVINSFSALLADNFSTYGELTGSRQLPVGFWLLAIGYWLLVVGSWLLTASYWLADSYYVLKALGKPWRKATAHSRKKAWTN